MIDPIDALAFSVQSQPGVYALLLGSGVSRSAQIPTGWEITLDLIHKLAATSSESAESDPEDWYREKYQEPPNYSELIDELAKTQAERQQLLRPYFEPSPQEREENSKQPTAAHRAIARLVAQGFVRVIITTNFDRLIEKALDDAGIAPTVIGSPDQVQGMLPLVHTEHCIIKVNGDYLDTRIRNTFSELHEYPDEINQLLDRIFDEFGLLVCGWSADWDVALRDAMFRAPSRRFTTYWAVHGEVSDEAQQLINHRGAEIIDIEDADGFFQTVQQKVESIEQFSQPHPLSKDAAITSLKRYISEARYRIQYEDLIDGTVERLVNSINAKNLDMNNSNIDTETVTARVRAYEAACSTLLTMAEISGRWAEEHHFEVWQRALERLVRGRSEDGHPVWRGLQKYPAILVLYTLGMAALSSSRMRFLGHILLTEMFYPKLESLTAAHVPSPFCMLDNAEAQQAMTLLDGMGKRYVPLNDWVHHALRQYMQNTKYDDRQYDKTFDQFEILLSLSYAYHRREASRQYWAPMGAFVYRSESRAQILAEISESVSRYQVDSPFVENDFFGGTPEECAESIEEFKEFAGRVAESWGVGWW